MEFQFKRIKIKNKILLQEGCLSMNDTGVCLLTGKNGTGKTLFLHQIYDRYQKDAIFCKQENDGILEHLSVIENISITQNKEANDEITQKLKFYQLEHLLTLDSGKMSGGEKRMVCLLRVIFSDRSIVLIDEPTNDLDYVMVEKLITIIKDYEKEKLFFMITHDNRFYEIAEKVFVIENGVIRSNIYKDDREKVVKNVIEDDKRKTADYNLDGKKKYNKSTKDFIHIWKKNRIGICFFVLISILAINCIGEIIQIKEETLEADLKENQINLFLPVSSMGTADLSHGAVPVKLVNDMLGRDLWKNSKRIMKTKDSTNNRTETEGIVLNNTKKYEVYPMEFFNQEERAYKYPLYVYLKYFLGVEETSGWIDMSNIMECTFMDCEGKRYDFDKKLYDKSVKKIIDENPKNGKKNEVVYMTVILKSGYKIEDFLDDNGVKQIITDNLYLQSNETITACNQLKVITTYKRLIKNMCMLCILILIIEVLFYIIYLFYKRKDIRILYDYGLEIIQLKKNILKCENDRISRIIITLVVGMGCFLCLYINEKAFVLLNYFPVMCLFLTAIFSWEIRKRILKKEIEIVCNWKYR